jgi:hypothetical protein
MSYFTKLLEKKGIERNNGLALWTYLLDSSDFENLKSEIKNSTPFTLLDPRDAALYYSEWWKNCYVGGSPSKELVFDSIGVTLNYNLDAEEFFKLAKKGAKILGVEWISKHNTLYFRSLILQGGLPLKNISEHHGKYKKFLMAVWDEQPETIEDFMFDPSITSILPTSCQNEVIYANCLEIIQSYINQAEGEENIYDKLFDSNENLKLISSELKVRRRNLIKRERFTKPQNYWVLNKNDENPTIRLKISLASKYSKDSLSNLLGYEVEAKQIQLYVEDELVCIFRKMINGDYNTDSISLNLMEWNGSNILPYVYFIEDGTKRNVSDFIQLTPNLNSPSLWVKLSEDEWRLIKGGGTKEKEAAVLFPMDWTTSHFSEEFEICNQNLSWINFEGEITLLKENEKRKYLSNVNAFDWIIASRRPSWMLKANMAVVTGKTSITVYDDNNEKLQKHKYKIWYKRQRELGFWLEPERFGLLPLGAIEVKIEKDGIVAYDSFYNIGQLGIDVTDSSLEHAKLKLKDNSGFDFTLVETPILKIESNSNQYKLNVEIEHSKIPKSVQGNLRLPSQNKLKFEMESPFEGIAITDSDGRIIEENERLTISSLNGFRILSSSNSDATISFKNKLKSDVIIRRKLERTIQPLIAYKEDLEQVFYLADVMYSGNKISMEIRIGTRFKVYELSGFSHTLYVDRQHEGILELFNSKDNLDLFAVPMNCSPDLIELIPLLKVDEDYTIPKVEFTKQFIIISVDDSSNQLMPRFVNMEKPNVTTDYKLRIEGYHQELLNAEFDGYIWETVLSYFKICQQHKIPFSTFDQLRALSKCSKVAAKAFFFLGVNQEDFNEFIQLDIPTLERDLGFCFHWVNKEDWLTAFQKANAFFNANNDFSIEKELYKLVEDYLKGINLSRILDFVNETKIQVETVLQSDIMELRSKLGEKVLNELPKHYAYNESNYGLPIERNESIRLILQASIAVAESIMLDDNKHSIWGGDERREEIRRNIQYCQYLDNQFPKYGLYNRIILQVLKQG